jgi:hypothetical protein
MRGAYTLVYRSQNSNIAESGKAVVSAEASQPFRIYYNSQKKSVISVSAL